MNSVFERDLARGLETETAHVGPPSPEFFGALDRRVRHRRRGRRLIAVGVTLCAVAAAGGGAAALVRDNANEPPTSTSAELSTPATPPPDPNRVPDWENLPFVRDLWPNAIRTLPGRLPDGSKYVVEAMLPDNRYIVLTWSENPPGFKLSRPAIFDPAAKKLTVLAPMDGRDDFVLGVGIINDRVVWVNHILRSDHSSVDEVWSAPLTGGPAQKIASVAGQGNFTIAGDYVMWDRWLSDGTGLSEGVYRLPVSGGQPELIPDTRDFILSRDYSGFGGTTAVAARGSLTGGELIDLITGRRFNWKLSPDVPPNPASTNHVNCGTVGCTGEWGTLTPPATIKQIVQNLDGTGYMEIASSGSAGPVGTGRYLTYGFHHGPQSGDQRKPTGEYRLAIWDRTTGRAAVCYSLPSGSDQGSIPGREAPSRPFVTWGENGNLMLLDLNALG